MTNEPLLKRTDLDKGTEVFRWRESILNHLEWISIFMGEGISKEEAIRKQKTRSAFTQAFWDKEIIPFIETYNKNPKLYDSQTY